MIGGPLGVVAAAAVWLGLARVLPVDDEATLPQRLALACAALLPMACVLNAMVLVQMRQRARSGAVDPLAGNDDRLLRVNQRVLTNTASVSWDYATGGRLPGHWGTSRCWRISPASARWTRRGPRRSGPPGASYAASGRGSGAIRG